jgi:hypothetical protein
MSAHASSGVGRSARRPSAASSRATFSLRRLVPATTAATVLSLAGVLAIRALAVSASGDTSRFSPLHPSSVISLTILGVLLAAAVCLWLPRVSDRPLTSFRSVGLTALVLSFVPDLGIWVSRVFPQTRAATVLPLIAMHVLVATVCLIVLPRLGAAPAED